MSDNVLEQFKLDNKVALVTGAAGLLGIQHARAIKEAGGRVILVDINASKLEEISQTSDQYDYYTCDITKPSELEELSDWIKKKYQRLDVLINNAALNPKVESNNYLSEYARFENYPMESYQKEIDVGLTGAFLCTKTLGALMVSSGNGSIINIASDLGLIAPNQKLYQVEGVAQDEQPVKPVTYSIIKHGLIGLTRYTATYWAEKGIRCNALAPAAVENGQDETFISKIEELIPMRRMAKADEYKAAIVFLASEASRYMNGAILAIDGGRTCW